MGYKKAAKINPPAVVVDLSSSSSSSSPASEDEPQGTPLRAVFCLKKREQLREFDDKEECFILDFDPFDSKRSVSDYQDPEMAVVAEKGGGM
ncbi:unnamed protein product [Cuscuta campestris]|uniref:Uncharacterized protein n=1 Tax=Cuscuta campestris TaxID=132261 RepID=A0A484LFQ4_9ASTE|nr:unnamed protein product [Cuscuta campestris]